MSRPSLYVVAPFALLVACLTELPGFVGGADVPGDRAADGCPEDELCSPETPLGLVFSGQTFNTSEQLRLGPVLAGGTFELGFSPLEGDISGYQVASDTTVFEVDDMAVSDELAGGAFLYGVASGVAAVRVLDAKGQLYDRLSIQIVDLDEVTVDNLLDPGSESLLAGCEALLSVHLWAQVDGMQDLAFDNSLSVSANGSALRRENGPWDSFRFTPSEDLTGVALNVVAGGVRSRFQFEVRPLGPDERCPQRATD